VPRKPDQPRLVCGSTNRPWAAQNAISNTLDARHVQRYRPRIARAEQATGENDHGTQSNGCKQGQHHAFDTGSAPDRVESHRKADEGKHDCHNRPPAEPLPTASGENNGGNQREHVEDQDRQRDWNGADGAEKRPAIGGGDGAERDGRPTVASWQRKPDSLRAQPDDESDSRQHKPER
jgi:hypothetical protein